MFQTRLDHNGNRIRQFSIMLDKEEIKVPLTRIKVIGVGNGGCNAINSMIKRGLTGVELIAINTDEQSLAICQAHKKIQIGGNLTRGKGTGGNPKVGQEAALQSKDLIEKCVQDAEMIFITSSFGGGTGTGASPVVASIARQTDAIVVGIVTLPFIYEGNVRTQIAEQGRVEMCSLVDSLITIPNQKLFQLFSKEMGIGQTFDKPNDILFNAVKGINDFVTKIGYINVDFSDVRTVLKSGGEAFMGFGSGRGENATVQAVQQALSTPFQENLDIRGSRHTLVSFTCSEKLPVKEFEAGLSLVHELVGQSGFIKFGVYLDESLGDEIVATLISTGFGSAQHLRREETIELIKSPIVVSKPNEEKTLELKVDGTYEPNQQEIFDKPTFVRLKGNKNLSLNPLNEGIENDNESLIDSIRKSEDNEQHDLSKFLRKLMD